jgi:UDP:flavonoid glycosyltransferase YjiC (YdhE family)
VLEGLWEPGRTVIGAQLLAFGARIFAEKHGVPLATIHLQPMAFLSVAHPPHSLPWLNERSPRPVRELFGWLADASGALALGPSINGLRREVGLPPARRLLTRWVHSPDRIIGLFPEWYASPDPDWPPQARLTGFPLYDEADVTPPPPDLESFLDGSDPPIVFTPGSANLFAAGFFRAAVEACERLGRRGVLLTRHAEQVPRSLPPSVRHFGYAPFSLLLPRAAALVHHGGIGTVAQGLAAGIPQLVMPLSYDQPDNAVRLQELGVGKALPPKRFTGANCARALEELLASEEVRRRCAALAAKTREGDPLAETCDLIEALGATS